MNRMFQNTHSLVSLNVTGWDTAAVTDMEQMFHHARSIVRVHGDIL